MALVRDDTSQALRQDARMLALRNVRLEEAVGVVVPGGPALAVILPREHRLANGKCALRASTPPPIESLPLAVVGRTKADISRRVRDGQWIGQRMDHWSAGLYVSGRWSSGDAFLALLLGADGSAH